MKLNKVFPVFFNSHRLEVNHGNSCIVLTLPNGSVKLHHRRPAPCGRAEEHAPLQPCGYLPAVLCNGSFLSSSTPPPPPGCELF